MIKGIHVAIGVADIERSVSFYRDILGMKVVLELDITDDRISKVIGTEGAKCRIVHMKSGGAVIELFKYSEPAGINRAKSIQQYDHGLIHVGLEIDDFEGCLSRLRSAGVAFLGLPIQFRPGVRLVYFRGPDGEVCELRQQSAVKPIVDLVGDGDKSGKSLKSEYLVKGDNHVI